MKIRTNIKAGARDCDTWICGSNHNEKLAMNENSKRLTVKTGVKAGIMPIASNHNEKTAIDKKTKSIVVKSGVKSGGSNLQHNEELARDRKLKVFVVKTGVKAGGITGTNHNEKQAGDK